MPSGKKAIEPLRDIKKKILRDLDDAIRTTDAGKIAIIKTTMDIYADATALQKDQSFKMLDGKIKVC